MRRRRLALPQLPLHFPMEVMQAISELPLAPFFKRGLVVNHSYEHELGLHMNENF